VPVAWLIGRGQPDGFVPTEREGSSDVHTLEHPYCGVLSCWCHTDVAYHDRVTGYSGNVVDTELFASALSLLRGQSQ
jgi:hypothetical protein